MEMTAKNINATAASAPHEGMLYNALKLGNYAMATYEHRKAYLDKWHPVDGVLGVFHHEFGHKIDEVYDLTSIPLIREMYRELMRDKEFEDVISLYAMKSLTEFYAEAWSEFITSPNPRKIASDIGNITIARINQYESYFQGKDLNTN
jgi:hypothetical protein